MNKTRLKTPLLLSLILATTVAARPNPEGPADYDDKQAAWAAHQALEEASPFRSLEYRAIGPIVQGGRLIDIEVVPDQPYTFYAAYASGGLWKTTNNGVTFEPIFDDQPTMIMGDIAVDPNRPETVWVGTGENNASRSSYSGMGVYRSEDGGESWRHMGLGDADRIGRILIDPRNSDRLFVGVAGKLYTPGGPRGVFRSADGGETWELVLPGGPWAGTIDLVFHPKDPDVIYAAQWERQRRPWDFVESGDGSGIWKSSDGGDSWQRLDGGFPRGQHVGRIGLAVTPAAPDVVYASLDNQEQLPEDEWDYGDRPLNAKRLRNMNKEEFLRQDPDEIERFIRSSDFHVEVNAENLMEQVRSGEISIKDILDELEDANANLFDTDIRGIEVWRSNDAGQTWRRTHTEPLNDIVYTYGYYFGQVRVSPQDADRLYILGVPLVRSDDGGKSFYGVNGRGVHVDHQSMWINPTHSDHVVIGNDGGMDVTYDGGKSWVKVDAQPVGQFYTVNVDMATPYNVFGGLQDNGTIRCSSRNRWELGPSCVRINGGDGMYVSVDPRDNKTTYTGYQFGNYVRLTPEGGREDVRPRDRFGEPALRYNWNTPVILSSHNPDIVYFGANRVYRSMNRGEHWTAISDDLTRSDARGDVPFATVTTLSESPLDFGLLWAGTDDGQVWVTDGTGWRDVAARLPQDRWVSRVTASAHERNRAYLSLNGYRDDDITAYVYRSDDLGRRWTDISTGLPDEPVNVIKEDPVHPDVIYVGTDRGVYVSLDRGGSWHALQGGLPNVPVHDLVVHPRDRELVVGTHGRSVWIVDVLPLQEIAEAGLDTTLEVFYIDDVQADRGWRSERSQWFYREEDDPRAVVHFWSKAAGTARIEILDDGDRVLRRWEHPTLAGMNRIEWDLLVDEEAAVLAEQARLADKEAPEDATDAAEATLADMPYAESVRLGHPLYALPGDYVVRVTVGDESAENALSIKAPDSFEPRVRQPYTLRGTK